MRRIELYFPLSHGIPRGDDRRILSGIIFVIRNRLRWRDAEGPLAYPRLDLTIGLSPFIEAPTVFDIEV